MGMVGGGGGVQGEKGGGGEGRWRINRWNDPDNNNKSISKAQNVGRKHTRTHARTHTHTHINILWRQNVISLTAAK